MDAKLKADWIEALRSGKYKQTRGTLKDENGHCCLGVLCEIAGIKITGPNSVAGGGGYGEAYKPIMDLIGIPEPYPLSVRNDGGDLSPQGDGSETVGKHSFAEIADYIEQNL